MNITLKYSALDVINMTQAIHMQDKQFNRHSWLIIQYCVTSLVVLFAYPIRLNISTRNGVTKIVPKKLYCHINWKTKFRFINTLIHQSTNMYEYVPASHCWDILAVKIFPFCNLLWHWLILKQLIILTSARTYVAIDWYPVMRAKCYDQSKAEV